MTSLFHPISSLLLGVFVALVAQPSAADDLWTDAPSPSKQSDPGPLTLDMFSRLAADLFSSVVTIEVAGEMHTHGHGDKPHARRSHASGFIIHPSGLVITNHHVVDEATEIEVVYDDGERSSCRVVGSDADTDIALLQIEDVTRTLKEARLGDSDGVRVGQWVMAIGNPFGLEHTVTAGIISGVSRKKVRPSREHRYSNFLQTDASINKGNSGGPLIDTSGAVVGMNTAINTKGQGIGFAIPINMVKQLLPQLAQGRVVRSWLGVMIADVTSERATAAKLSPARGAWVSDVVEGGPADGTDLRPGDIIIEFDGSPIETREDLPWLASNAGVGRTVVVKVVRDGGERNIHVTLGERVHEPDGESPSSPVSMKRLSQAWSIAVEAAPAVEPAPAGVRITELGKSADAAGARTHDLIVGVAGKPVVDVEDFLQVAGRATKVLELEVWRDGRHYYVPIKRSVEK